MCCRGGPGWETRRATHFPLQRGYTPLMRAALFGRVSTVALLLEDWRVNVNASLVEVRFISGFFYITRLCRHYVCYFP